MNSEMIMNLVDVYAWRSHLNSDKEQTGKARDAVIAAIEQLTKDAERGDWLLDRVGVMPPPNFSPYSYSYKAKEEWPKVVAECRKESIESIDAAIAAQKGEQV